MDVYVAIATYHDIGGITTTDVVGVFATYQKALDYLGECYKDYEWQIQEEQIQ